MEPDETNWLTVKCTCGQPTTIGVVHRTDGPCYYPKKTGEWVGLTQEEAAACWNFSYIQYWKNIEEKLKEKNT
jgi:hypothetical protein